MKVIPRASNHILLELESGVVLDINDGTGPSRGALYIKLETRYLESFKKNGVSPWILLREQDDHSACHLSFPEIKKPTKENT